MLIAFGLALVACGEVTKTKTLECQEEDPLAYDPVCVEYCDWHEQSGFGSCSCLQDCEGVLATGRDLGGDVCEAATITVLQCASSNPPAQEWDTCAEAYMAMWEACAQARHMRPGSGVCLAYCDLAEFCGYDNYEPGGFCYVNCWSNLDIDASQGCFAEGVAIKACVISYLEDGCRYVGQKCKAEEDAWEACVSW
ncbi:MAG: hypothetical protein KC431_08365 [Myxococcales bacterium]|nr:hypothetical protein [Myxococcales bacterium]